MEDDLEAWCNKLLEIKFEVRLPQMYAARSYTDTCKGPSYQEEDPPVAGLLLDNSPAQPEWLHAQSA